MVEIKSGGLHLYCTTVRSTRSHLQYIIKPPVYVSNTVSSTCRAFVVSIGDASRSRGRLSTTRTTLYGLQLYASRPSSEVVYRALRSALSVAQASHGLGSRSRFHVINYFIQERPLPPPARASLGACNILTSISFFYKRILFNVLFGTVEPLCWYLW